MTAPRLSAGFTRRPFGRRLRRYFLVGMVVVAPVGLTILVLQLVFEKIDAILGVPLQRAIGFRIPGLGIVLLLVFLVLVGWVVHFAAGRQLLHWWNRALSKFPLTGRIYNAVSQIVQSIFGSRRRLFLRTVMVPYPVEGVWVVAFVTNEEVPELSAAVGEPCVNVFVPTTPNPTSGFMLVVPKTKVIAAGISVEEAMKLVISAGAVAKIGEPSRRTRPGLDLESLLKDTQEWQRDHLR